MFIVQEPNKQISSEQQEKEGFAQPHPACKSIYGRNSYNNFCCLVNHAVIQEINLDISNALPATSILLRRYLTTTYNLGHLLVDICEIWQKVLFRELAKKCLFSIC